MTKQWYIIHTYSGFEERVKMLLDADPDAYFFPRLYLSSPRWWDEKHPDDLVTFDPGDGKPQPFFHSPADKRVPSWASEAWRRDTAVALRRFIQHVEQSPYGRGRRGHCEAVSVIQPGGRHLALIFSRRG